ncbi:hypothetical protein SBC1_42340 (plasmid) [Caballeronia sp. SBC1]|uniref:hypothetical protein n=1 Tax=unclassified Caballeronia TaxID=2646786 RepID=UPI0013E1A435|nr:MULTISPECIES: hypothetical protein [unclassified Caballeronia]QIE26489.1 hypothetical protein SBC2_45590 [Caballeronia sp. SBC2]QIN64194.1 hypothetical protein SBC1_42340 [Caballeronia sp. SBC1]
MATPKLENKPFVINPSELDDSWLSRSVAWIMPWLFLSLRRALIPTVCLIILAALFYLVPQSRDILGGFAESVSNTAGSDSKPQWEIGALMSYLFGSVLVALAVWYCSRLLCTVEAWLGMPMVWALRDFQPRQAQYEDPEGSHDEKRVRHAIKWLPRTYGVAALGAAIGALMFANVEPGGHGAGGLMLVVFGLAGPLLFVTGAMRGRKRGKTSARNDRVVLMSVGGAAFAISCGLLIRYSASWKVGVLSALCTLLPAALLWFLMARRAIVDKLFSTDLPEANDALRLKEVTLQVIAFIVLGFGALIALAFSSTGFIRTIGSAATVMLFLAAAVVLISGIQLLLRHVSRAVPGFTSFVVVVVFVVVSIVFHEPVGHETLDAPKSSASLDPPPQNASPSTAKTGTPNVIVNAYGGGLRAAIYTAQVLALADDASCGLFGDHIQTMSSVSGGSLGVAVYLAARQELKPRGLWKTCRMGDLKTPLTDVVTQALVQDHLSPVIARMLSVDLVPAIHPQRGMAMLRSWNDALIEALKSSELMKADSSYQPSVTLAMPIARLDGAISPQPKVYFNTTDADTGARSWFSNVRNESGYTSLPTPRNYDVSSMPLGEAVLHSARFPIISPAGAYPPRDDDHPHRLVDGGYADNSGGQTLWDHASNLAPAGDTRPFLLDIDGNPPDAQETSFVKLVCEQHEVNTSHVPTSVLALLSARSAHALDSEERLAPSTRNCCPGQTAKDCLNPVQINLEKVYGIEKSDDPRCEEIKTTHMAPLGWYTSRASATLIRRSSGVMIGDVCQGAGIAGCVVPPVEVRAEPEAPA